MTDTAITVHRSIGRRVFVGDKPMTLYGDDWPTRDLCETAASKACVLITRGCVAMPETDAHWDALADHVARTLGVDLAAPFGCALILEPVS